MKQEKMIGHRPYAGVLAFAALCAGLPGFITASALGNDECTTATVVEAGVPVPFSTLTATLSGNPPTDALCPNTSLFWGGSRDVWFKWVAPASGIARFSTCDVAGYDTSMVVYAGDCGNLTPVACNGDAVDSTGCQDLHAEVKNLEVLGGATYYIRIGGYDGAAGAATFTLTYSRVGAWGSNANGQLRVPLSAGMLGKIAAGGEHALGLRSDGTVIAWGATDARQCGRHRCRQRPLAGAALERHRGGLGPKLVGPVQRARGAHRRGGYRGWCESLAGRARVGRGDRVGLEHLPAVQRSRWPDRRGAGRRG